MPVTSASWKASLPSIGVMVWPVSTIIGTESISAVSKPGHRVRGSRARSHQGNAHLAGRTGVAVGHVGRALLVTHEDQLDLRVNQRVEDRHRRPTRQSEDDIHPLALETLDDLLATRGYLLRCQADTRHGDAGKGGAGGQNRFVSGSGAAHRAFSWSISTAFSNLGIQKRVREGELIPPTGGPSKNRSFPQRKRQSAGASRRARQVQDADWN